VRDLVPGAMFLSRFQISTHFVKLVERGINLEDEDVFYNYTNMFLMTRSHTGLTFRARK
jgi:hypothetical protein